MKKRFFLSLVFFAALTTAPNISSATLEVPTAEQMQPLHIDGLYRFSNFKEVSPLSFTVNGKSMRPDGDDITYVFNKREPVRVEFLKNGIVRITRGTSDEDSTDNPSQLEISVGQFNETDLQIISDTSGRDLQMLYAGFINEQFQLAARGRRGRHFYGGSCRRSGWGTGQCVSYIKMTEGIRGPLGNGGAVARTLHLKYGYRPTNCGNPQPGTIASWPGHVGKWDGSCWRTLPASACNCNNGDPGRGRPTLCVIR